MKKILVSSVVATLLSAPMIAQQVYSDDDKSVDVYGSIRGFVGGGFAIDGHTPSSNGVRNADADSAALLMGLQTNTSFGFNARVGDMKAKIEFGLREASALDTGANGHPGIRHFYGEYSFGDAGSFVFGKMNTPTIDMITNDVSGNDAGANGFGGTGTGARRIQLQYRVAGVSLAIIQEQTGVARNVTGERIGHGWNGGYNNGMPRLAVSYVIKNDSIDAKLAGTYKHYSSAEMTSSGDDPQLSREAFHVSAQAKYSLSESAKLGAIVHYGINGNLYGEQQTVAGDGTYGHAPFKFDGSGARDVQRAGGYLQLTYNLSETMKTVLGAGYQITIPNAYDVLDSASDQSTRFNPTDVHSFSVMGQLPFKLGTAVTLTPQIGYYASKQDRTQQRGALAFIRTRYDF